MDHNLNNRYESIYTCKPCTLKILSSVHHISYYIKWDPQENYYYVEKGGFKSNSERTQGTYSKYTN